MKKTTIFTLILAMLLTCVLPMGISAEAEAQPISTVEEFEAMSATGNYYLTGDIDFGGKSYTEGYILADFSGTLDGRGYAIHNFSLSYSVSAAAAITVGVFKTVCAEGAATIKNLKIGKEDALISVVVTDPDTGRTLVNTSLQVGLIAAKQASSANLLTIDNVDVYADMDPTAMYCSATNVGGFVGTTYNCAISNSTMSGNAIGWTVMKKKSTNVAGFVGEMRGVGGIVENCVNYADISAYYNQYLRVGGIVSYVNPDEGSTAIVKDCVNFGKISAVDEHYSIYRFVITGDFGGIVGEIEHAGDGMIDSCINFGDVTDVNDEANGTTRCASGGILGWARAENTVKNCVNYGTVTPAESTSVAGAIVGSDESNGTLILTNNVDKSADVTADPSLVVGTHGVQESEATDGAFNVRFLATVNTLELDSVGFEIVAYYNDNDGNAQTKTYNVSCTKVYDKIIGKAETGLTVEETAENLGGEYIYALSILGVPAVAENGNVTFVYRAVAKDGDTTVYGGTVACSYRNGEFLYCSNVG